MSESERVTFILTASDGGRLPLAVAARSGFQRSRYRVTEKIEALGGGPAGLPLLTDDYAPVERLTAGLLLEGAAEPGRAAPPAKDNINNASNLEAEP